jgi:hypothetical protein
MSMPGLSCRTCDVAVAESKSRKLSGDFSTALGFHVSQLQETLAFEHEQAVVRLDKEFREALEGQQREIRRLGELLRQRREQEKGTTLWPLGHEDEVGTCPQSPLQPKRVQRSTEFETDAASVLVRSLPETLRQLADEQDRALRAQFSCEGLLPAQAQIASSAAGGGKALHIVAGKSPTMGPRPSGVAYWNDDTERNDVNPVITIQCSAPQTPVQGKQVQGKLTPASSPAPGAASTGVSGAVESSIAAAACVQTLTHSMSYFLFELLPAWNEGPKSDKSRYRTETAERKSFLQLLQQTDGYRSPFTISPNSRFALTWSILFLLMLLHDMILFPMSVFNMPQSLILVAMEWLSVLFWTMDLVSGFFVGYFDQRGELVMDRYRIIKHYVRGWLLPDVIFVSTDWLMLMMSRGGAWNLTDVMRAGKVMRCVRVLRILRVIRLKKMHAGMYQFDVFMNSPQLALVMRMVSNIVGILMCSHFVGCAWYLIGTYEIEGYTTWIRHGDFSSMDWYYEYLTAFHWALTQFTPGSMSVQPENPLERSFSVGVLVLGMVIFSSIISSITQVWNNLKNMTTLYDKQLWNLRRYLREQSISTELVTRVIRYAEHVIRPKLRKVPKEEVQMFQMLPDSLFMDVILEIYDQDLEVHPLFEDLLQSQRNLMQYLCRDAIQEIMLSQYGELFGPGQIAGQMYFMRQGLLTYCCRHLDERKHVGRNENEKWIAEAVLWTNWVHQGTCEAETESTVIALCNKKFVELACRYRSSLWGLKAYGRAFVREMNEQAGNLTSNTNDDVDLSDLFHIDRGMVGTLLSRSWDTLPNAIPSSPDL